MCPRVAQSGVGLRLTRLGALRVGHARIHAVAVPRRHPVNAIGEFGVVVPVPFFVVHANSAPVIVIG